MPINDAGSTMAQPVDRDLVKSHFPAFAEFRDRLGMRTASSEYNAMHWFVRLESDSFNLSIGEDRADDMFYIQLHGSERIWDIQTILHEIGLWDNLREQADHRKLAAALEQNLPAVLNHIAEKKERPVGDPLNEIIGRVVKKP